MAGSDSLTSNSRDTDDSRGVRGIFFQKGQSHFPQFFPGNVFFQVKISKFGRPKTNFNGFEK